jgi:hypothetical protein
MPKTKEQVFSDLKSKLPNFVTFDESTYLRFDRPARFIDSQYGEYWISPKNASKGQKHKKRAYAERHVSNKLSVETITKQLPSHLTIDPSTYLNTHTKAKFIDLEYGEFWVTPNFIRNGGNHKLRSRKKVVKSHKYSEEQASSVLPNGITLHPGTYIASNKDAIFIDPGTGKCFKANFASVRDSKILPPSFKKASREKAKQSKIDSGLMNILPNGKCVTEYCREFKDNPSPSQANVIYKTQSPEAAQKWIETHSTRGSDIEVGIIMSLGIEKFNKFPNKELKYKPDFKLSDKIYLNTDGLYWHSELWKSKPYHWDLRKAFEANGLRILQFRQNEILHKSEIVKSIAQNAIGSSLKKLNGRDCKVVGIASGQAKDFLSKNHIKGHHPSCKYLGLTHKNQLVCVMGFKIIKNVLKIERFCSLAGTSIRGSLGKLLAAVEKECHGKYSAVHYWVDLRYGTGNSLEKFGFSLSHDVMGFEWTDGNRVFNRLKCRANMDNRKLSEKEHANELKWYKIYDAGQRLFIKNVD